MRTSVGPTTHSSILCAVDFSRGSRDALRWAARLARTRADSLTVLYVNDPLLVAAAAAAYDQASLGAASEQELRRFVTKTLGAATMRTLTVHCRIALGRPATEIMKAAAAERSDLVVVGSRGLNGPQKLLLGSTTDSLLHRAPVPVLAVPETGSRAASTPSVRPSRIRTVVAGITLGRTAQRDASAAADVARQCGASLVLVHVVPQPSAPSWFRLSLAPRLASEVARASRSLARLAERLDGVRVSTEVHVGRPAEALREAARLREADLVVMQRRAQGTIFGQPAGTCTYEVLCGGSVPVLALPDGRAPRRRG